MSGIAFLGETALSGTFLARRNALQKCTRTPPGRWSASVEQAPPPVSTAKRLRKGDVMDLTIDYVSLSGASVAHVPDASGTAEEDVGLSVYMPKGASPGDVVRCSVTRIRRNPRPNSDFPDKSRAYAEAIYMERISPSPSRIPPRCDHFGNFRLGGGGCGGCTSMSMDYAAQLREKQAQMVALFRNFSAMDTGALREILPSLQIWNYRNKMEFSYGRKWSKGKPVARGRKVGDGPMEFAVGLHAPQRFDKVVEITRCHIQEEVGNEILAFVRTRAEEMLLDSYDPRSGLGYMRNVAIRTARNAIGELEVMVNVVTSPCEVPGRLLPLAEELIARFPTIVCVVQNMPKAAANTPVDPSLERLVAGPRRYIEQKLCGLIFQISANSFFQTNPHQAGTLYGVVAQAADLGEDDVVCDLFCGTGTIGLTLAGQCKKVVGLEIVDAAVEDARRNAKRNGIGNAEFVKVNLEKMKDSFVVAGGAEAPDVIVVDPPRAGLHKSLVKQFALSTARRIVYVSCNPASQMRDLRMLEEMAPGKFRAVEVQPVCMFPHTHHVESVVTLVRTDA